MFRQTDDPSLTEDERVARDVEKVKKANDKRDMQRLIQMALATPIGPGEFFDLDGETPLLELGAKNTTARTRIIINAAISAGNGDDKARQFLFKYGGYEPVKEQSVTVDLPVFIDDMDDGTLPEMVEEETTIRDEDPE